MPSGIAPACNEIGEEFLAERACSFFQSVAVNGTQSFESRYVHAAKHCGAMDDGLARLNVSRKTENMGRQRNNVEKLSNTDDQERRPQSSAVEENVQAIKRWERAISMHARKPKRSATGLRVPRERTGVGPPRPVVRRVGDRKLRSGRRHSPIRSVPLSVPHHDRP